MLPKWIFFMTWREENINANPCFQFSNLWQPRKKKTKHRWHEDCAWASRNCTVLFENVSRISNAASIWAARRRHNNFYTNILLKKFKRPKTRIAVLKKENNAILRSKNIKKTSKASPWHIKRSNWLVQPEFTGDASWENGTSWAKKHFSSCVLKNRHLLHDKNYRTLI